MDARRQADQSLGARIRGAGKKALACLMALVLVVSLTPLPASAAQAAATAQGASGSSAAADPKAPAAEPSFSVGNATYGTIAEAVAAAKSGDTIALLKDVDLTKAGTITMDGLTLDLGGHTISADNSTLFFQGSDAVIQNGGLSAKGGSYGLFVGDSGTTNGFTVRNVNVDGGINVFNAFNVVLEDVTVDNASAKTPYYAVWCDVNANVVIKSGTYRSSGPSTLGLTNPGDGKPQSTMAVEGGTYYSTKDVLVLPGKRYMPVITGGTFFSKQAALPYLAAAVTLVDDPDGMVTAVAQGTPVPVAPDQGIPSGVEIVQTAVTPAEQRSIDDAVAEPQVAQALQATGGTGSLWEANVVLRDTDTLAEHHDQQVTFVLPYPAAIDASRYDQYRFTVVHLKAASDGSGVQPEVLASDQVKATEQGLQITSTLSPFAIGYELDQAQPADKDQGGAVTPAKPSSGKDGTAAGKGTTTKKHATSGEKASGQKTSGSAGAQAQAVIPAPAPADAEAQASLAQPLAPTEQAAAGTAENPVMVFDVVSFERDHWGVHPVLTGPIGTVASPVAIVAIALGAAALVGLVVAIAMLARNRKKTQQQ